MKGKSMKNFNPLESTEKIHEQYVEFFKTEYALDNEELSQKLDNLLRKNLLWKPPFISITQNFESGQGVQQFSVDTGISKEIIEATKISRFYKHQERAITNVVVHGRNTIISSGTGSGKTESFLIPILNECNKYSDVKGIKALIIYPMNALANDQVDRIRDYLFTLNEERKNNSKKPITFGIYTGQTPSSIYDSKTGKQSEDFRTDLKTRCPSCGKYELHLGTDGQRSVYTCNREKGLIIDYQIATRSELKENPPDILITNYVQLEYLLLRESDASLWQKNMIKFIALDEIHAYGGARGVDVALLMRRLRSRIENTASKKSEIIFIGTSATISKAKTEVERTKKISEFASKLFGVNFTPDDIIEGRRIEWNFPITQKLHQLQILDIPSSLEDLSDVDFAKLCKQIDPDHKTIQISKDDWPEHLGVNLRKNKFFQTLVIALKEPLSTDELKEKITSNSEFVSLIPTEDKENYTAKLIWSYLRVASLSQNSDQRKNEPLVRISIHNFFRGIPLFFTCTKPSCKKIFFSPKETCDMCHSKVEELAVCRDCGNEFLVAHVSKTDLEIVLRQKPRNSILAKVGELEEPTGIERYSLPEIMTNSEEMWCTIFNATGNIDPRTGQYLEYVKCLKCGSFSPSKTTNCNFTVNGTICKSIEFVPVVLFHHPSVDGTSWRPHDCPYCGGSYGGRGNIITKFDMSPKQASVNLFNLIYDYLPNRKLLIFTDNRQNAASLAGYLDFAHEDTAIKQLIYQKLKETITQEGKLYIPFRLFLHDILLETIRGEWYNFNLEDFERSDEEIEKKILVEITDPRKKSLERLGLIEVNYKGLIDITEFTARWNQIVIRYDPSSNPSQRVKQIIGSNDPETIEKLNQFTIRLLYMMRHKGALSGLEKREYLERTTATGFRFDLNQTTVDRNTRGIEVIPINSKNFRAYRYAQRVFGLDEDDEPIQLIEYVWYFLIKEGFVVETGLSKGFSQRIRAYVVSQEKLRLSIPKEIKKCTKCRKVYVNVTNCQCPTEVRRRICDGSLNTLSFDEFALNNKSHFFNLFKNGQPHRMVTTENTGALTHDHRKRIQAGFVSEDQKERTVDVTVGTPTLELGVDIGDLSAIGQYKSPPSPVNYLQRVGRAGRRDGVSFINTFFFNSPIDEFHFQHPEDLIKGSVEPPFINFENDDLIKRHINALILEEIFINGNISEEILPKKINEFVKKKDYLDNLTTEIKKRKENISHNIRHVLYDIGNYKTNFEVTDNLVNYLQNDFTNSIIESIRHYENDIEACERGISEYTKYASTSLLDTIKLKELFALKKELERETLLGHFFDTGVLPRYAFPGSMVSIETLRGEKFEGRPRNIAISEYAPKCEITLKKRIYRSCGVDVDKKAVEHFYVCQSCLKFYSKTNWHGTPCPLCKDNTNQPRMIRSISPKKIYLEEISNSVNEYQNYMEPNMEVFLGKHDVKDSKKITYPSFEITVKDHGNLPMMETVGEIFTEYEESDEEGIERSRSEILICTECGKVKQNDRITYHRPLTQKFRDKKNFCKGTFEPLSLHHEMMTNVVSIKIESRSENLVNTSDRRFLTTLKNAIIFASQPIVEAAEGEIDGEIKSNEIILYDNVDGGAGYVRMIYDRIDEILKRANANIQSEYKAYGDACEHGCLRCLWSFRRKLDIPYIDKQLILPLLGEVSLSNIIVESTDKRRITTQSQSLMEFEVINSKPSTMEGAEKIKQFLRSAIKEVIIYSPKASTREIDFDEGRKSWLDVIGSIRGGEKNVKLKFYTLKHETEDDVKAVLRLLNDGVEVFEVDSHSTQDEELLENGLIVIDPYSTDTRRSIEFTASLTEQLFYNYTVIKISKDESGIKSIMKKIDIINTHSKATNEKECEIFTGFTVLDIKANDEPSLLKAVEEFKKILKNAKEIKISDPHLQGKSQTYNENLHTYMSLIHDLIPVHCVIKLVTANHNTVEVNNEKTCLNSYGHDTEILTFQTEQARKRLPLLHQRYVIVNDQVLILLDKGLRFLFEYNVFRKSNSDTHISISAKKSNVDQKLMIFDKNWNYQNSDNDAIRDCPKFDTREQKQ